MFTWDIRLLGLVFYIHTWLLVMISLQFKPNRLVLRWNNRSWSNRTHHVISILVIDQSSWWFHL